jgi:hypothetical protein
MPYSVIVECGCLHENCVIRGIAREKWSGCGGGHLIGNGRDYIRKQDLEIRVSAAKGFERLPNRVS